MTGPSLHLYFSATADLYFLFRHLASLPDATGPEEWADVVEPARNLFELVSHVPPHVVDGHVAGWDGSDDELETAAAGFAEDIESVPARRFVTEAARMLATYRSRYDDGSRQRRERAALATIAEIDSLLPKDAESSALAFICETFGLEPPSRSVPVIVVASGVPLGGFTGFDHRDEPICVVAGQTLSGSLLVEIVLHESVHALGIMASNSAATPIARLQEQVSARGLGPRSPYGQLWHVPYFVTAAEAVRRFVDSDHVPYGIARGYYGRAGAAADIAVPLWTAVLEGDLDADRAVDRMIAELPEQA